MSHEASAYVKALHVKSSPQKLLLLLLAERISNESGICWPGQALLAQEATMSLTQVKRHLKALEEGGMIQRQLRHNEKGHIVSTNYTIPGFMDWLEQMRNAAKTSWKQARSPAKPAPDDLNPTGGKPQNQSAEIRTPPSVGNPHHPSVGNPTPNLNKNHQDLTHSASGDAGGVKDDEKSLGRSAEEAAPAKRQPAAQRPLAFAAFWAVYPNKAGRNLAMKAWSRLSADDRDAAIARMPAYLDTRQAKAGYIQNASTYLIERTWEKHRPALIAEQDAPPDATWKLYASRMETFMSRPIWPASWGPKPGQPGCRMPDALIRAHSAILEYVGMLKPVPA